MLFRKVIFYEIVFFFLYCSLITKRERSEIREIQAAHLVIALKEHFFFK